VTMRDTPTDSTDRLQLIVANEADREAIRTMLSKRYDVVIAEELQAADCYLVDDRSLPATARRSNSKRPSWIRRFNRCCCSAESPRPRRLPGWEPTTVMMTCH